MEFSKGKMISRYDSHFSLPQIGKSGQVKLGKARVLLIGMGGLGSPSSLYLAAAGVGNIGIVDDDEVSLSNLQRQILYSSEHVHHSKVKIAHQRLTQLNPEIRIIPHELKVTAENSVDLIKDYDIVIDGTDNFQARYLINDACVFLKKPNIFGAVHGFDSQLSIFCHLNGPCYRCLYPVPPSLGEIPNCRENGVLGVLPGVVGTLQATEAIKLILEMGTSLVGQLLTYNALEMTFSKYAVERRIDCIACGSGSELKIFTQNRMERILNHLMPSLEENPHYEIAAPEFKARLEQRDRPFQLLDVRTTEEYVGGHISEATHIPLHELEGRLNELKPSQETVIYCHAGIRSLTALAILKNAGFTHVRHLKGGLRAVARLETQIGSGT